MGASTIETLKDDNKADEKPNHSQRTNPVDANSDITQEGILVQLNYSTIGRKRLYLKTIQGFQHQCGSTYPEHVA